MMNKKMEIEKISKSFYIMKVIYNNIITIVNIKSIRNVQQSLNRGKPKYILKINKNGD